MNYSPPELPKPRVPAWVVLVLGVLAPAAIVLLLFGIGVLLDLWWNGHISVVAHYVLGLF